MILYQQKHTNLKNVAASQLSTLDIPSRNNHHGLLLNFISVVPAALTQAQIETDVSWVSITLTMSNGKQIKIMDRMTPAEIFDLLNDFPEASKSTYTNAGSLYIPFTRPGQLRVQNWSLSLGMLDVDVYEVQVQFTAGLTTASVVEVIPVVDRLALRPLGEHIELRMDTRDWATISEEPNLDAPHKEPGTALMRYHIGLGSAPGVIENVDVQLDDTYPYTNLDAALNNFILHQRGFTPNADYFHVMCDKDFEPLDVGNAKTFINKWNWSTAPTDYRVVYELICGISPNPNVNTG